MVSEWQRRRAVFNHDWLKNQYMPALAKFLNLLNDQIEDPQFEQTFVMDVLPKWEGHYDQAKQLPQDFEQEMSPRRFVERVDFGSSDYDGRRLADLMHHLWLARYPIQEWVEQAKEQVRKTDRAYRELQESLAECDDVRSAEALRPFREEFAAFRDQCQELATTIEQFPSEIKVV
jgi:hypothetical protein